MAAGEAVMKRLAGEVTYWLACFLFFVAVYIFVYFVTASFAATHHGPIKWDEGVEAVKELLNGDAMGTDIRL